MAQIDDWFARITAAVDAVGIDAIRPLGRADRAALVTRGHPGVLPLWQRNPYVIGLLALPDVSPEHWPAVMETGGDAFTLATDASTLVPRFLFVSELSRAPGDAAALAGAWPRAGAAIAALHETLGGDRRTLDIVIESILDPARREPFESPFRSRERFDAAHGALARRIDDSPAFAAYADWIDASLAGRPEPAATPDAYGCWARQVFAKAVLLTAGSGQRYSPPGPILTGLVEAFAGLDTSVSNSPSWFIRPGNGSAEAMLGQLADRVDPDALADPLSRAMAEAIRVDRMGYDGLVHAGAVPALAERGEPARAWGVLQSAAWWMAKRLTELPASIFDGARLLVRQGEWGDLGFVVDQAAGATGANR